MKILLVSDHENRKIWDFYEPGMLAEYDLILSAGDLSPHYLSFLATMSRTDVLYVRGNHDRCYDTTEPEGCISVDGDLYDFHGLRILGLGGSMKYRPATCMYTEEEMEKRIRKLQRKIKKAGGFDILLTHAPAAGINDGEDLPHRGFRCFRSLIEEYKPKFFIHGHMHKDYGKGFKRITELPDTTVVNACDKYVIEIPDEEISGWQDRIPPKKQIHMMLLNGKKRIREKREK